MPTLKEKVKHHRTKFGGILSTCTMQSQVASHLPPVENRWLGFESSA